MEVIFRVSEDILIASIKGEVDHHSAAPLRQSIDRSMKAFGCKDLILDFTSVEFMDSSGIGVALGRYKKLSKSGGQIYISGCSSYIEKVLDMAGVFSIIPKADSFESAVELMRGQEQMCMEV
ncbi:MAG: anti-sigma factor antagonist [Bacillota bacterium]|nr:anti-sigma factor antagonist [Bacillota bacterium]